MADIDDPVNKPLHIGFWIFFIILSSILNGFVIVSILLLYDKKPLVRLGSPKLFVILVCCVLQFVNAVGPSAVGVHINRVTTAEVESSLTCEGFLTLELVHFMLGDIVTLLIGAVVSVEGLRLQRFVSLTPQMYMAVAVVLVVLSVLFGFVVVIPVFFFRFLQDKTEPCHPNSVYLNIADKERTKLFYIVDFIVPHCLVSMACLLLLMAYFTRSSGSRPGVYAQSSFSPLSPAVSGSTRNADNTALATNAVISGPTTGIDSAALATESATHEESCVPYQAIQDYARVSQQTGNSSSEEDHRFPWYIVLAAIVSFVFHFVFFFQAYHDLYLPWKEHRKLWVAGILLLSLKGVFLPCCWLLDGDVRSVWSCCSCHRTSARSARSPEQVGQEMVVMECLSR